MTNDLQAWITPQSLDEAKALASVIAGSELAGSHKGKPANVLICMMMSAKLNIDLMQALQNIAVINNRPAIWGPLLMELAMRHPKYVDFDCGTEGSDKGMTAWFTVKYLNGVGKEAEYTARFSMADAIQAGIVKDTYKKFPADMLIARARCRAINRTLPGCTHGLAMKEEMEDAVASRKATVTPAGGSKLDAISAQLERRDPVEESLPSPQPAEMPQDADWEPNGQGDLFMDPAKTEAYERIAAASDEEALFTIQDWVKTVSLSPEDQADVRGAIKDRLYEFTTRQS